MTIARTSFSVLPAAPTTAPECLEIAFQYNEILPELWNSLSAPERIFIYYLYRAMIPGNSIYTDQRHRHALLAQRLFKDIINRTEAILKLNTSIDTRAFIAQCEQFLIYLYANHGQYFMREFARHKRTPKVLKLDLLTPENIRTLGTAVNIPEIESILTTIERSIFDAEYEPTVAVPGNIEQSAGNMYSPDFTQADFEQLSSEDQIALNSYCYIETENNRRTPRVMRHKIGGKYSAELTTAQLWIDRARAHAAQYPEYFDNYIIESLEHLSRFLLSGDEEDFKKFSISWIKTNSKIDFNFGFIEVYEDPKQYRGSFEADITIKTVDMRALNKILPSLEASLPFAPDFKRANLGNGAALPNASINAKFFATGEAGPVSSTAAYCLPNYAAIRAEHGSKQIIYHSGKSVIERKNFAKARLLFNSSEHVEWLNIHDPEGELRHVLHDILTILHETLGHGSGKLSTHTFIPGDLLTIEGKLYAIGDTIPVTDSNIGDFIGKYYSGLEELRAEIIALLTSIRNFDALAAQNLFKGWEHKISKEALIDQLILCMAKSGLSRLMSMHEGEIEITQAHAQANSTIMHYLIDHGGLAIIEEQKNIDGIEYTVIDLKIIDRARTIALIEELACLVQRIKSTGDTQGVSNLLNIYGVRVRNPEYIKILKTNLRALVGDIKETVEIYPTLTPIIDSQKNIIDINATWPKSFLEEQTHLELLV